MILIAIIIFCIVITIANPAFSEQTIPEIYEPGIISTEAVELSPSLSSDQTEIYFSRSMGKWGKDELFSVIYYSIKKNNKWTVPEIAPFSGKYNDSDPHLTRSGKTLYFVSERPGDNHETSADIWKVDRLPDSEWGEPVRLPDTVNSSYTEYGPRTTANGDLYFASDRPGGYGQGDLYTAKFYNNSFQKPENLGNVINQPTGEWNLAINVEGNILIFEASQRNENQSSYGDLYISFLKNEKWTTPQNILEINTTGSELYAEIIESRMKLLFSSSQSLNNPSVNIYTIDFLPVIRKYSQSATHN